VKHRPWRVFESAFAAIMQMTADEVTPSLDPRNFFILGVADEHTAAGIRSWLA
jgi:hypothetical protein